MSKKDIYNFFFTWRNRSLDQEPIALTALIGWIQQQGFAEITHHPGYYPFPMFHFTARIDKEGREKFERLFVTPHPPRPSKAAEQELLTARSFLSFHVHDHD